jgi:hypothetical protein
MYPVNLYCNGSGLGWIWLTTLYQKCSKKFLTLTATALFFLVVSLPQVTLNLVAQVTGDLAVRLQYCLCCLPSWQLVTWIYYVFTFFDKLKETFKFCYLLPCQRPSPSPLYKQDTVTKSCMSQVTTRGAVTWQVLFFLPRVAGFLWPRSHMTWIFGFLFFFYNKSKRHHCKGKVLKQNI